MTDKDGKDVAYKAEQEDSTLTITAKYDFAILTGGLGGMNTLKAQGVEKIVFVTNGAESAFMLSDLLEKAARAATASSSRTTAAASPSPWARRRPT